MSRYIDADKIRYRKAYALGTVAYKSDIDKMPTADVQEVKHGKWKKSWAGTKIKECSRCNYSIRAHMAGVYHFCPNCGAKMDLEEEK